MADIVIHRFVSTKPDSPDPSLVSATEWNEGHQLTGGANGQILVYDNTQLNNIRWIDGFKKYANSVTVPASTPVPIIGLAPISLTASSAIAYQMMWYFNYVNAGSAGNVMFNIVIDGSTGPNLYIPAPTNTPVTVPFVSNFSAGSHTLSLSVLSAPGSVFSTSMSADMLTWGVV